MKKFIAFIIALLIYSTVFTQSIGINNDGTSPHASAILDVNSTTKGILIPRMTMAQRNTIGTPAIGLMIYQTDNSPGMYLYNGTSWYNITTSGAGWGLSGNSGTNPVTHFIGTSDNQPLRLRLNNTWAGELNATTNNIFLGDSSGISTTSGTLNTSLGIKSLKVNATGLGNTAIGSYALNNNYMSNTTAVGSYSLFNNTYGVTNSALGYSALRTNTIGSYNTAIGYEALRQNQIGNDNTSLGYQALYWNTASYNTAVGTSCLAFNTTGQNNTAVGMNALYNNTIGHENTGIGRDALLLNATGSENTSLGYQSLASNNGSYNTALGTWAMTYNTDGPENTAVGNKAMYQNTSGGKNLAVGAFALYSNEDWENTAIGYNAMAYNISGCCNTAVGKNAMNNNVTGIYNVAIGIGSGTFSSYNNTTALGNYGFLVNGDNKVYIGNGSVQWIGGNVTWSTYSDSRIKMNIREDVQGLAFINRLRPVTYYKDIDLQAQLTGNKPVESFEHSHDIEEIKISGFLAQEVEQAAMECGYDFSGITKPGNEHELYTLSYESFVVPLVKAIQEQQAIIESQNQKINSLETRLAVIELAIGNINRQ